MCFNIQATWTQKVASIRCIACSVCTTLDRCVLMQWHAVAGTVEELLLRQRSVNQGCNNKKFLLVLPFLRTICVLLPLPL